jgi:glycosyltransferase involved in cell wall biosynthesis
MPIVVAHIVHWPKSGIGTVVRQLAQFDQQRFKYLVILLQGDPESEAQFAKLGIPVLSGAISRKPLVTLLQIRRQLRAADIVHTHSFLPHLIGTLLARKGSRQVRTVHNPYPYFSATQLRSRLKRWVEGLLVSRSQCDLVAVSRETQAALPWPAPQGASSTTIENGIVLGSAHTTRDTPEKPPGFLFVTLGRLERQKGFDVLLEAFALLQKHEPPAPMPVSLWLIGAGSCQASLQKQAETLGLTNITFVGYQTAPERWLGRGDAFVLPSRFEGFSLAVIEALALHLPVILTDIGGIAALLRHEESAHIVPKEDPERLAAALYRLASDGDYRDRLARNGTAFVAAKFSMEKCAASYSEIYLRRR